MRATMSIRYAAIAVLALPAVVLAQTRPALDYEFYRSRVEPIFLAKKDGHTRCVVCHTESSNNFNLQKLDPGATTWADAQSRRNFAMIEKLASSGDPETSMLTQHPLAP